MVDGETAMRRRFLVGVVVGGGELRRGCPRGPAARKEIVEGIRRCRGGRGCDKVSQEGFMVTRLTGIGRGRRRRMRFRRANAAAWRLGMV